jgi:hypothetical protein
MIDDDLYNISDDEYNNAIQVNNIQYSVIIEENNTDYNDHMEL